MISVKNNYDKQLSKIDNTDMQNGANGNDKSSCIAGPTSTADWSTADGQHQQY